MDFLLHTLPPCEEEALSSTFKHCWPELGMSLGSPVLRHSSPGQREWVKVPYGECDAAVSELGSPRPDHGMPCMSRHRCATCLLNAYGREQMTCNAAHEAFKLCPLLSRGLPLTPPLLLLAPIVGLVVRTAEIGQVSIFEITGLTPVTVTAMPYPSPKQEPMRPKTFMIRHGLRDT